MSFIRLDSRDVVTSVESIVTPSWSGNVSTLTTSPQTMWTSSLQSGSLGEFFLQVYNNNPDPEEGNTLNPEAEEQFTISYGHSLGIGAVPYDDGSGLEEYTPSRSVYGQYRNLVYGPDSSDFTFGTDTPEGIIVINVNRARYKEKIALNSLELELTEVTLVDKSPTQDVEFLNGNRVVDIVKDDDSTNIYGKLIPELGLIILNANKLASLSGYTMLGDDQDSTGFGKSALFFEKIVSFTLRSEESITSNFVFARVRNDELNYTTNPSMRGTDGRISIPRLINSPQVYITTIGLYNDSNELLAVAKLSRPLIKTFNKEALIRLKLDY